GWGSAACKVERWTTPPGVVPMSVGRRSLAGERRADAMSSSQGGSEMPARADGMREILDALLAFVGVTTPEGVVTEVNRPALAAARLSAEYVIGRPSWGCGWFGNDARVAREIRVAVWRAAAGESVRLDVEARIAGGARIWIDLQIVPVRGDDRRIVH